MTKSSFALECLRNKQAKQTHYNKDNEVKEIKKTQTATGGQIRGNRLTKSTVCNTYVIAPTLITP